jgi:hypothetical protein
MFYFCQQCTYIVFILQCQNIENCAILLKSGLTVEVLIIFKGVFYHIHVIALLSLLTIRST